MLLKVDGSAGQGAGGLALSDYNKPFTPALPPNSQVIDYAAVVK